jgi:ABC-2 type transport system permease protein
MPTILLTILRYVFDGQPTIFTVTAPLLLGLIPFLLMFIVTSVAVLRERTSGTLERLLTSPASRLDILLGYALAFATLATIQASLASFVVLQFLGVTVAGSSWLLVLFAVLSGLLGMSAGLFFSAFAKNEFQAVQFMPIFFLPQFLTCGLFIPRDQMATFLRYLSDIMPITYLVDALKVIRTSAEWTGDLTRDLAIVIGFIAVALTAGALSLRSK